VRISTQNRLLKLALLVSGILLLALPSASAQEDTDTPLGDVARSLRKKTASSDTIIDNDNFSTVMDSAESRHAAGTSLIFSFDPGVKAIHVSSPDVTCSLSFTAKSTSLLSDPFLLDDLPRSELAKLDGPATIDGDSLQVSMHNGTLWELREVVIGLTIVKRPEAGDLSSNSQASYSQARIVPAAMGDVAPLQAQDSPQKQPDVTLLLHAKGLAAPSATAIFRTSLNFALFPDQDWHWAIVRAKGVPPQAAPEPAMTQPGSTDQPPAAAGADANAKAAAPPATIQP
jgi:hypothetical protein